MMRATRFLAVAAGLSAALLVSTANAQLAGGDDSIPIDILDGRRFAGKFVPDGEHSGRPDEFVFVDGQFHSRECLKLGFTPGPYWLRIDEGRVHFRARLTSEENGVMTYEGSIAGNDMDASIDWIKPRWYWTMKRKFRFLGVSLPDAAANRK